MLLFNTGGSLKPIKEVPFKLERDMQRVVEANTERLLNLTLVRSEFALHAFRIDTLAFDDETRSFVIIEYKRDKTFSVIDQGYAYLSLMLNNKADFILEYNESMSGSLKRGDVDWSQSKVIFISPAFTSYQREAINFKDLPIALWEIKKFENDLISFEEIKQTSARESIKVIAKGNKTVDAVSQEVKVFTEQDHLQKTDVETRDNYHTLRDRILNLDPLVTIQPKKQTVGFKVDGRIFCDIVLQGRGLKIYLNMKSGELKDDQAIARDVSNIGHWGNGAYEIKLTDLDEIDYILSLLMQSLRKNKQS